MGHGALLLLYSTDGDSADLCSYKNRAKVLVRDLNSWRGRIRWFEISFAYYYRHVKVKRIVKVMQNIT